MKSSIFGTFCFSLSTWVLSVLLISAIIGLYVTQKQLAQTRAELMKEQAVTRCNHVRIERDPADHNDFMIRWTRLDGSTLYTNVRDGLVVDISIEGQTVLVSAKQ